MVEGERRDEGLGEEAKAEDKKKERGMENRQEEG